VLNRYTVWHGLACWLVSVWPRAAEMEVIYVTVARCGFTFLQFYHVSI